MLEASIRLRRRRVTQTGYMGCSDNEASAGTTQQLCYNERDEMPAEDRLFAAALNRNSAEVFSSPTDTALRGLGET